MEQSSCLCLSSTRTIGTWPNFPPFVCIHTSMLKCMCVHGGPEVNVGCYFFDHSQPLLFLFFFLSLSLFIYLFIWYRASHRPWSSQTGLDWTTSSQELFRLYLSNRYSAQHPALYMEAVDQSQFPQLNSKHWVEKEPPRSQNTPPGASLARPASTIIIG